MSISLDYGLEEKTEGIPLNHGIDVKTGGVSLDFGIKEEPQKTAFEEVPFSGRHPNLYGAWGAAKEVGKSIVPYLKYVDPDERERFMKLSQQKQTRELLFQTLETVAMVGTKPIAEGTKAIFAAKLPKTFEALSKVNRFGKEAPAKAPVIESISESRPDPIVAPTVKDSLTVGPKAKEGGTVVYRGGDLPLDLKRGGNEGISVTTKKDIAENFMDPEGGTVSEAILPNNAKILQEADIPVDLQTSYMAEAQKLANLPVSVSDSAFKRLQKSVLGKQRAIVDYARANGYDAVDFPFEDEIRVIKPGVLKGHTDLKEAANIPEKELPKYAGSVNLEKQNIPTAAKELELKAAEGFEKKVQTWDETTKLAEEIAPDYEKVFTKAKSGNALNAAEIQVVRQVNVFKATELKQMAESGIPKEQFDAAFKEYSEGIFKATSDASSEAGRALNIHKKEVSVGQMTKAMTNLKRSLNDREFKEFLSLDLENPTSVKRFTERLGDPKVMDYVYEYWYNSILSGIPTHVVNVASNTLWGTFQVPHRILEGAFDLPISKLTGAPRTRFINETIPYLAGMKTGLRRGSKSAWEMFRFGKIEEQETKWAQEIGSSLGAFDRSPIESVRKLGKVLTVPTKALRAMDVGANAMGYDAEINSIARQLSNRKGLKGIARTVFEKKFAENIPDWAHKKAIENGKYITFMSDPGWFSGGIIGIRNNVPGGRFIVPFVNTIGNLTKRGIEMTPGLGLTLAKGQTPANVIAKQIEGSVVGLYMLAKADAGEITGAAPVVESERESFYRQGKQPWSIRFGDKWVSYRRVEPFNTILASVSIAYDRIKNAKDEETATGIFMNMANDLKNNLIDSSYMQGVTQILNRHGKAEGSAQRLGSSLVPFSGFWRSVGRSYEVATEGSAKVRDTNTWLGTLSQTIPLMKKLPAKVNVWGEEITFEGGMFRQWMPYKWSLQTTDKTELSLEKLGIYPGLPSQMVTIKGEKVRLDDDIYRDMILFSGSRMKKKLDVKFNDKVWQEALEDPNKKNKLTSIINSMWQSERELARKKAIREQQLKEK